MPEERIVGIDLGTTNSLVAYMDSDSPIIIPGEDGSNLVPSVVALTNDARGDHIIVGNRARTHLIETPERASVRASRISSTRSAALSPAAALSALIVWCLRGRLTKRQRNRTLRTEV